jgi:cytochrome c peroxidase
MRKAVFGIVALLAVLGAWGGLSGQAGSSVPLTPKEELGRKLFFDARLSDPEGQSCAACHDPAVGMTGADPRSNRSGGVYEGAKKGRFGNRKPPASAYAGGSPVLRREPNGDYVGGMFWDGRATGEHLNDPLAEQAMGPFLNPLEQALPSAAALAAKVRSSAYAGLFERVWGAGSLAPAASPDRIYEQIGRSIAAYERSAEVNPFSSRFDDFWRKSKAKGLDPAAIDSAGRTSFEGLGLNAVELSGLELFAGKAMCAACHSLASADGKPPVFTDFRYDNVGVPANPKNPFYAMPAEFNPDGTRWIDLGLGGFLAEMPRYAADAPANRGKHKAPTLRNVDLRPSPTLVKAYMHNGYFTDLKDIVRFYNTRDVASAGWPKPEVAANLNTSELGRLGLTAAEEDAIVAFLKTLSDRR